MNERVVSCTAVLKYTDGKSYSYNKLKLDASDNAIYDFAQAVNSLQDKDIKGVVKSVRSELMG